MKGKKKASMFKPVNFVVIRGKKVKCRCLDINKVLGCSLDFMYDYIDFFKNKTIEDLKGWLSPLLSNVILEVDWYKSKD